MKGLKQKVVIIAGGASGIGAAAARRLSEEGANVLIGDINMAGSEQTVADIVSNGGKAQAVRCDLADEPSCAELINHAQLKMGGVHGLFNVAADLSQDTLAQDTNAVTIPLDVLERTLKVNLMGYFYTVRHAIPAMLAAGGGSIINTTSGVVLGQEKFCAYGAAKAGVIALTRHIATTWGKQKIRANAIDPGIVLTENQIQSNTDEERAHILPFVNAPNFGEPDDIASMIAYLLSDESKWINGQTYVVSSMDGAR